MNALRVQRRSMKLRHGPRPRTRLLFAWPIVFATLSIAGLVLGLTGDGARDLAAWITLGSAPAAILYAFLRPGPEPFTLPFRKTQS